MPMLDDNGEWVEWEQGEPYLNPPMRSYAPTVKAYHEMPVPQLSQLLTLDDIRLLQEMHISTEDL